jgi:hypothetical protein
MGDHNIAQHRLEQEAAQFQDSFETHETRHTTVAAPRVEGEYIDHPVHETVRPIVHRDTVATEVLHSTVPIHETHHASNQRYGMSTLPMKMTD